ncbi:hypothetical protein ACFE04_000111 [Oxalis oulophora]
MFTEGLDENAINWIKQGSSEQQEEATTPRSPLTENISHHHHHHESLMPHSPSNLSFNNNTLFSPSILPPLSKFNSALLPPHSINHLSPHLRTDNDNNDEFESVDSVSDEFNQSITSSIEEELLGDVDLLEKNYVIAHCNSVEEDESFNSRPNRQVNLNKGLLFNQNLSIQVPHFNNGDSHNLGFVKSTTTTPGSSRVIDQLRQRVQLRNAQGANGSGKTRFTDIEDLGTPSAPPILDIGEGSKSYEIETEPEEVPATDDVCHSRESETSNEIKEGLADYNYQFQKSAQLGEREMENVISKDKEKMLDPPHFNASSQYAWQTLVAYDACIRLCLYAWARGCPEAPEFLSDECLILRSAFGLHKFLLQSRHAQPVEARTAGSSSTEQVCPSKVKKVVGKIRIEGKFFFCSSSVKRVRVIPRRKLRSIYSQRSAMYMKMGAEYVQQVSSLVKTGMNSLKLASFPITSEEPLLCLFQLKSAAEETQADLGSAICLHPGSGDYHFFFPETEGDALLVEVKDKKKSVQGRATIPVSTLSDNPNDRVHWWPLYYDDQECIGKIQLSIERAITSDESNLIKSGPVVETFAYDLLLEASMRAQHFHSRNLRLQGPWMWLLTEFADHYGVSVSYTKLRYLSHITDVATPTKDCLELVNDLLVPILKAKSERNLTRQEKTLLLGCETQIESLLANVFENYKLLDEKSQTGLADIFGPLQESAPPALAPAVQVYTLLHDILSQEAQNMLTNYLQTAAKKRCRKHMMETDEFVSGNSEAYHMDFVTISTAYSKMRSLCINIRTEIQADIKIHNQHVLPTSIDLSNIAAAVYSTELNNRLKFFLAAWPPSCPLSHVNELLIAVADFERDLELWGISKVQGGVDSRSLFHDYIMLWVEDLQLKFLDLCKAEKVPWSGVTTSHSTSPFAEEMYEKIKDSLTEYEVVINRWPQYSLVLENAAANVERAILKALEKQYNDILTPLKDSIPKRLNMHVQKLTRRQSTTLYSVPNQLGIFLNTIKRILDVLHCRVEDMLKSWASYLPAAGDKKALFGEQMNGITVTLRTKYKNYLQATVEKLVSNMQVNRYTRLKKILEEIREEDGEAEVREKMQMLSSQLMDCISNLHEVFTGRIFIAASRGFWDRMGQIVLKFLEGRKENQVWYNGCCHALGILDDTFASQMQRLQGNLLQEKDLDPPRSVVEARSILCKDAANATDTSTYFY